MSKGLHHAIPELLLKWFEIARRPMPWRETRDPYAIWLSETMLQQTQVETVKPYYHKFLKRFPSVRSLAEARLDEVLEMWAGLGYYRRAKHLHAAAGEMLTSHAGQVPASSALLMELPGVGRYTAGAVASIAFSEPVPVVDGNVARVLARLTLFKDPINTPAGQKKLWHIAGALMKLPAATARPGDFNQALMELGAMVCTPINPQCPACPVNAHCRAKQKQLQQTVPVKIAKAPAKVMLMWTAVLRDGDGKEPAYLLMQRPAGGLWERLWEFPTFAFEEEGVCTDEAALAERLGVKVKLETWRGTITHQLTHRTMQVAILRGTAPRKTPRLPPCGEGKYQAAMWATADQMKSMAVGKITWKILEAATCR